MRKGEAQEGWERRRKRTQGRTSKGHADDMRVSECRREDRKESGP